MVYEITIIKKETKIRALSQEEFLAKLKEAHGNEFELLSPYTRNSDKVKLLHKKCGKIIEKQASKMINAHPEGCYYCNGKNRWKTTKSFQQELDERFPNKYTVLGEYVRARQKLLVRNNFCGHEYMASPDNLLRGKGCPLCGIKNSKYARFVEEYLKGHKISFVREKIFEDCINKRPLPFDFYLSDFNVCIEVDGEFHYIQPWNDDSNKFRVGNSKLEEVQFRDGIKTKYCENNQIKLIRLPYFEFKNFETILNEELSLYVNAEVS